MADIPGQDTGPDRAPETTAAPDAADKPKPRLGSLRALWPFVLRHKGLLVAWLVSLAASSTATLSLPLVVRRMIDHGFSGGGNINATFALVFAVALTLPLSTAARFFFVPLLGERVVADLRARLYSHLVRLDQAFFERSRSGQLVSRLTADTELLLSVVGSTISGASRSVVMVDGSLAILLASSPWLADIPQGGTATRVVE